MGCAESRTPPNLSPPPSPESLPFPLDFINKVTRKYAPNRFISEAQFQAIITQLQLTPLSEGWRRFYDCVRRGDAYDRLEMLVAHVMYGRSEGRTQRLRLLFETVDEEYVQVVTAEKAQLLIRTMLRVAVSYYLRANDLSPSDRAQLLATEALLEVISRHLLHLLTDSAQVSLENWQQLAENADFQDIGTPKGLRKAAITKGKELIGSTETEDSVAEPAVAGQSRRRRHRGTVTERGMAVSAHIQAKMLQKARRTMPI